MNSPTNPSEEIAANRRKYLRWSTPSLILAFITVVFTLASHVAQNKVHDQYVTIVTEYTNSREVSESANALIEAKRADLAAKRLVVEDSSSPAAILRSAQIGLACSAKLHAAMGLQTEMDTETRSTLNEFAQRAKSRAIQSMLRASKMEGVAAMEAKLWASDWRFRSMRDKILDSETGIHSFREECEQLIAMGAPAELLLADALLHEAMRLPPLVDWNSGQTLAQRAHSLLIGENQTTLEARASRVESQSVFDPENATADAVQVVLESSRHSPSNTLTWKELDAIFRCRLRLGNPQEAFDFAWKSLSEVPSADREIFRWNTAASAMRTAVILLHRSDTQEKDLPSDRDAAVLFGFALRFAPDSPMMTQAFDFLLTNSGATSDPLWTKLLHSENDQPVSKWVAWLRSHFGSETDKSEETRTNAEPISPSLVPASVIAMNVARQRGLLERSTQLRMLDDLIVADESNEELRRIRQELASSPSEPRVKTDASTEDRRP